MQKERNKDYFLWRRFKGGDNLAFYQLYDEHIDSLFCFGMQFSKDKSLVEDCIHDLFLDLHKYKNQLSDTDSIKFYLFKSLKRKIRKQQSRFSFLSVEPDEKYDHLNQTEAFEETLISSEIRKENIDILTNALKQLSKKQQKALFLKFEQNLTYPEIASLLGISIESARTNIYRAIKILRERISEEQISINLLFHLISKTRFIFFI